jgi:hypothetical protein
MIPEPVIQELIRIVENRTCHTPYVEVEFEGGEIYAHYSFEQYEKGENLHERFEFDCIQWCMNDEAIDADWKVIERVETALKFDC